MIVTNARMFMRSGNRKTSRHRIALALEEVRKELLDLGLRNTLINHRPSRARGVEVVGESATSVFEALVQNGKSLSFAPAVEHDQELEGSQPKLRKTTTPSQRRSKSKYVLQTDVSSEELHKRLLNSYYSARTSLEEQGVSVLYLAIGALRWYEDENSSIARRAPLMLIPVELTRTSATEAFRITYTGEEIGENLSLTEKLKVEFGVLAPPFPDLEGDPIQVYFDAWQKATKHLSRWRVEPDTIWLGFFSFGKFLMYRDLAAENWPDELRLDAHPTIRVLLGLGNEQAPATPLYPDDARVDDLISLDKLNLVVDADSSQTLAILEAREGRNLVIQGPPGTGKSQTITNIIADAIAGNRTVLFVSEKMAALEVVKRRLDTIGLGDACLELHSHKSNKRYVLAELERTLQIEQKPPRKPAVQLSQASAAIRRLNGYCNAIHEPLGDSGVTPYQALGSVIQTRISSGIREWPSISIPELATWSEEEFLKRAALVEDLEARLETVKPPKRHPFWGIEKTLLLPSEEGELRNLVVAAMGCLRGMKTDANTLAKQLGAPRPKTIMDIRTLLKGANRIASAPVLLGPRFDADEWTSAPKEIRELVDTGVQLRNYANDYGEIVYDPRWRTAPVQELIRELKPAVEALVSQASTLAQALRVSSEYTRTPAGVQQLVNGAQLVMSVPAGTGLRFASQWWKTSRERIERLVELGIRLTELRRSFNSVVSDSAWSEDLTWVRTALQEHHDKWLRILSSDYRAAKRTLRSHCIGKLPDEPQDLFSLLDQLIEAHHIAQQIRAESSLGQDLYGHRWNREMSEWTSLREWSTWILQLHADESSGRIPVGLPEYLESPNRGSDLASITTEVESALGNYRRIINDLIPLLDEDQLRALALGQEHAQLAHQLHTLTALVLANESASKLASLADYAPRTLGSLWNGEQSDWDALKSVTEWTLDLYRDISEGRYAPSLTTALSSLTDTGILCELSNRLQHNLTTYQEHIGSLFELLSFDPSKRGWGVIEDVPLISQTQLLNQWNRNLPRAHEMIAYNHIIEHCRDNGLSMLVQLTDEMDETPFRLTAAFQHARQVALIEAALKEREALRGFERVSHEQVRDKLCQLDPMLMERKRDEIAHQHRSRLPKLSNMGQIGILQKEFQKKSRHRSIRNLIGECGNVIQAIKPVFMMSPMSIATYLPPGAVSFDLVIFDEASQVRPADALGAIARGKQVIVVGDSKQLPPTRFFDTLTHVDTDDFEEESATQDIESVLGLFLSKNTPTRMLRWHYRSRHESLIAVSNHEFYDGRLITFPSPDLERTRYGLILRHCSDTYYDRGSTRTNPIEARMVAEAVIQHAKENKHQSLGVAAFSSAQAEAILGEVEALRVSHPEAEDFFAGHLEEPFFIKNLENVQGDERDVIFISIGYGWERDGRLSLNFGPLNANGGERRLNVLITRARQRCEVFTNMRSDDIDLRRTNAAGIVALKRFLQYAESGHLDLPRVSDRQFGSPFEEAVHDALTQRGYTVHSQVGSGGYFIDLAVVDPDHQGRYLLAIECDGATYHRAQSARDRDRLRQLVLEGLGWTVHRIWSTDWFRNSDRELERLIETIERLRALPHQERVEQPPSGAYRSLSGPNDTHSIAPNSDSQEWSQRSSARKRSQAQLSKFYKTASLAKARAPRDISTITLGELEVMIEAIVRVESPVHELVVVDRLAEYFGFKRRGSKIAAKISAAISRANGHKKVVKRGDFLWRPSMTKPPVRNRSALSGFAKTIEAIAPEEIQQAVLLVVRHSFGISREDIPRAVGNVLGFQRVHGQAKDAIVGSVDQLIRKNKLQDDGRSIKIK